MLPCHLQQPTFQVLLTCIFIQWPSLSVQGNMFLNDEVLLLLYFGKCIVFLSYDIQISFALLYHRGPVSELRRCLCGGEDWWIPAAQTTEIENALLRWRTVKKRVILESKPDDEVQLLTASNSSMTCGHLLIYLSSAPSLVGTASCTADAQVCYEVPRHCSKLCPGLCGFRMRKPRSGSIPSALPLPQEFWFFGC